MLYQLLTPNTLLSMNVILIIVNNTAVLLVTGENERHDEVNLFTSLTTFDTLRN